MQLSLIDILFLVTVALLVFNGLRHGALFSLLHLLGIPIAFGVIYFFGPQFVTLLASNNLPATPLIAYIVLFLGTILIIHIGGNIIRGLIRGVPGVGLGDSLLGGLVGFVEAWLVWLVLLIVLGNFLGTAQSAIQQGSNIIPGLGVQFSQLQAWHDFYNDAITNSIFAQVNSFFVKQLPNLPTPPR
ncbi:MAG: CvpA family protein [Ktedonobacteraceae bacterium]|nr:CvpA family protein [Ktedonobacteraceae bacterium]